MILDLSSHDASIPRSVEMSYDPPLRRVGFIVSGVSLLLVLALGFVDLLLARARKFPTVFPSLS